ncbi:AMID-like mitochondrial oxidoreductase [Aspergillus sclerotialis]|uniref:AMID-like mitochondrial oxidoreductase n=1 Tax=Aspergillus sclerotialis TaxID=2070753 RepID=A0A3A3A076_9EURO|nr:AMID-like mitochondrial oxidoreductase [Aspergillus sclerotialis]
MTTTTTSIVVIGGSYAGIGVSHGLLQQLPNIKVTLINPSTDLSYNIASPRFLTKPDLIPEERYIFSIPDAFKKYSTDSFQFVHGKAKEINLENKLVSVEGSTEDIKYDYLVIASGSTTPASIGKESFPAPFKAPIDGDVRDAIKKTHSAIGVSKSIIIGGAGPVGVEFAGELVEVFGGDAKKEITLISGTEKPLASLMNSAQDAAAQILRDKGVTLKTSAQIEKAEYDDTAKQWTVTLAGGETLKADLYISAMGTIPNNNFIPSSLLDKEGWVGVDKHLRALNDKGDAESNVYALGDISSHKDRLLLRVPPQIATVVANLKHDITGDGGLRVYLPEEEWMAMLVPIGRSTGTGVIGNWRVWGFLVSFMKGRDFLIGKAPSLVQG